MTEKQKIAESDVQTLATPGDDAAAPVRASHPTKGRRYRVMGKGEGDHCIYQIAPNDTQFPQGCLIPLPEVPRFESTAEALRWIRTDSGDLLAGKEVMVFCAMEILRVVVTPKPVVEVVKKPKILITKAESEEGEK